MYIEDEVRDADAVSIVEALRTAVSEDYVTKEFRNFLFEGFPRREDHFAAFEERVSCVSPLFHWHNPLSYLPRSARGMRG